MRKLTEVFLVEFLKKILKEHPEKISVKIIDKFLMHYMEDDLEEQESVKAI